MKLSYKIFAIAILTLAACKKEKTDIAAPPTPPDNTLKADTTFYIEAPTSINAYTVDHIESVFSFVRTSAEQKRVYVSFSGFPQNADTQTIKAWGYPDFETKLIANFNFTPSGVYPIIVTAQSEGYAPKMHKANLIVDKLPDADCQMLLSKLYTVDNYKITSNSSYPVPDFYNAEVYYNEKVQKTFFQTMILYHDSTSDINTTYRPYIAIAPNTGSNFIEVWMDCETGKILIPQQKVIGLGGAPPQTDTFSVIGEGKADIINSNYTITYTSISSDNSKQPVEYTISGVFRKP